MTTLTIEDLRCVDQRSIDGKLKTLLNPVKKLFDGMRVILSKEFFDLLTQGKEIRHRAMSRRVVCFSLDDFID